MLLVYSQLSPDISLTPRRPAPFKRHCGWRSGSGYTCRCFITRGGYGWKCNTAFAIVKSIIPAGTSKILQLFEAAVVG